MFDITSVIAEDREFPASIDALASAYASEPSLPIVINGLTGGAKSAYLTEAVKEARRISDSCVLVLVATDEERDKTVGLLSRAGLSSAAFKLRELIFYNVSASADIDRERLSVLAALIRGELDVIVTTPAAFMSPTMPKDLFLKLSVILRLGDTFSPKELCDRLVSLGFSYSDSTEAKGQFSHRGGIVDLWSAEGEYPVRIEFFGDEIDRIVTFDPLTQRSIGACDSVSLLPAYEVVVDKESRGRIIKEIDKLLSSKTVSEEYREKLKRERSTAEAGLPLAFRDKYIGLIYGGLWTLRDYFPKKTVIFVSGTQECRDRAAARVKKLADEADGLVRAGMLSKKYSTYSLSTDDLSKLLYDNLTLHLNTFAGGVSGMKLSGLFGFRCRSTVAYGENINMLREDIEGFVRGGYRVILLSQTKQGAESVFDTLEAMDIHPLKLYEGDKTSIRDYPAGTVMIAVGEGEGFDLCSPRVAVLSLAADSGKAVMAHRRRQAVRRKIGSAGKQIMNYAELSDGDYVVHANYGIGRFLGVESVTIDGVTKDYITIQYAGTDRLFVPCDKLEMIGKYIGERDKDGAVKLSVMGGADWTRAKSKAKSATRDIAKKLIRLYAERQSSPGYAFPEDSELQAEFESEFMYEETDSQLSAIADIKRDMTSSSPMNRLLCGDVGYGKTEVALRAAFKAILGGKQVALLVPTTILALQHYQTALSRMRSYAINVEMLSRFRKPKARAEIIKRTARGEIDLLIGTHAMISKQVTFRDLGLLIIDEEQRFGVAQKEKLREMAANVDTLMLSATPIPRTLNMAISGISDISVLDEAPGDRRPVATYVLEHDDGMIYEAIRRELDRRGQVLYLYNNIEDIALVAGRVEDALPDARVAFAHGRMEREEIEDIWHGLVVGEIDVLVCTTIIETGVDLPNANTLIIENADRFGLSQLHQIRGRVGRSERQAYAYLTYRPGKSLTEVAAKRLATIEQFAEFGAGFKIALRDMEIRGAGNLLGAEQHGYIESVGYDLYIKLLNEAIEEERGTPREEKRESLIDIKMSAHIPENYIGQSAVRMSMYKRIADIRDKRDALDIIDEFTDRFGDMPVVVERLINVALAKALAEEAGIERVSYSDGKLSFVGAIDIPRWAELFEKFKPMAFLNRGAPSVVHTMKKGADPAALAAEILSAYSEVKKEE